MHGAVSATYNTADIAYIYVNTSILNRYTAGNNKILYRATFDIAEQSLIHFALTIAFIIASKVNIQPADGMPITVKDTGERPFIATLNKFANRRPRKCLILTVSSFWHTIFVQFIQLNVVRQLKVFARIAFTPIDLLCQICQFRTGADFVGIINRTSTTSKLFRRLTIPHITVSIIIQRSDVVLTVILVLGVLLALVILTGLVGVVAAAVTLVGILTLVTGVSRLLFIPAVLVVLVLGVAALGVLVRVSVSRVCIALDDGRAAVHHLRGKGRGSHQRQREHHAHQQAHDAPGHTACPFLHVICLLSLLNVSI